MRGTLISIVLIMLAISLSSYAPKHNTKAVAAYRVQICRLTLYYPNSFPAGYEAIFDNYSETWVIRTADYTLTMKDAIRMQKQARHLGYSDAFITQTILYLPMSTIKKKLEPKRDTIRIAPINVDTPTITKTQPIDNTPLLDDTFSLLDTFDRYLQS